jgi:hypothetical protein
MGACSGSSENGSECDGVQPGGRGRPQLCRRLIRRPQLHRRLRGWNSDGSRGRTVGAVARVRSDHPSPSTEVRVHRKRHGTSTSRLGGAGSRARGSGFLWLRCGMGLCACGSSRSVSCARPDLHPRVDALLSEASGVLGADQDPSAGFPARAGERPVGFVARHTPRGATGSARQQR